MFPIPWNFPFRKKDGSLAKIEDLTGTSLPEYSASDTGKLLGVDDEGELEWKEIESELPEYSESDAGKVLAINDSGELEWAEVSAGVNQFERTTTSLGYNSIGINAKGGVSNAN